MKQQRIWCEIGGHWWERPAARGRPPKACPSHADRPGPPAAAPRPRSRTGTSAGGRRTPADLKTCFLLADGWAFRLQVNRFLLAGKPGWNFPLTFAEAIGLAQDEFREYESEDHGSTIGLWREGGRCSGGAIDEPLRAARAAEGDLAFIGFRGGRYRLVVRHRRDLADGDLVGRLLWSCGLDPADAANRVGLWPRLGRVLGGKPSGAEEVRERLKRRGDESLLAIVDELLSAGAVHVRDTPWPPNWALTMPLLPVPARFAVTGRDGTTRIALGVVDTSGQPPPGHLVTAGGLVWRHYEVLPDENELDSELRSPPAGLLPAASRQGWVRWLRVEHAARRAALSGREWRVARTGQRWTADGRQCDTLLEALEQLELGGATQGVCRGPRLEPHTPYPRAAISFRDAAKRTSASVIEADSSNGFKASSPDGTDATGAALLDVLVA